MPFRNWPEQMRMKAMRRGALGSMFAWILEYEALNFSSTGSNTRSLGGARQRLGASRDGVST